VPFTSLVTNQDNLLRLFNNDSRLAKARGLWDDAPFWRVGKRALFGVKFTPTNQKGNKKKGEKTGGEQEQE
jgi:hypothetical protein